jgi:DNA polymerase
MKNSDRSAIDGLLVHLEYLSGLYPDLPVARSLLSPQLPGRFSGEPLIDKIEKSEIKVDSQIASSLDVKERMSADLEVLAGRVHECRLCSLGDVRLNPVFGEGHASARLLFIGEGPGAEEDRTGRPFVGRAGELLDRMIVAMGLSREEVYIANAVKCRPPANRTPEKVERDACKPFLLEQIRIVSPEAIVLLGQTAIFQMLSNESSISSVRGKETVLPSFPGIRVMPTYHPAYLLRNPQAKAVVWKDLQQVMQWLSLPITS